LTKFFHPNIATSGEICVNTLKKDWNPTLGLRHVLLVSFKTQCKIALCFDLNNIRNLIYLKDPTDVMMCEAYYDMLFGTFCR
jgi:hypothetical protein